MAYKETSTNKRKKNNEKKEYKRANRGNVDNFWQNVEHW